MREPDDTVPIEDRDSDIPYDDEESVRGGNNDETGSARTIEDEITNQDNMSIKTVDIDVSDGEPEGNPNDNAIDVNDLDKNEQYAPL